MFSQASSFEVSRSILSVPVADYHGAAFSLPRKERGGSVPVETAFLPQHNTGQKEGPSQLIIMTGNKEHSADRFLARLLLLNEMGDPPVEG
jgi:hypothetical protein